MYDVLIIGAGICGAFMARDLSRYELNVALVDREDDIACGATMANSAIVHSGHDPEPGTLKARFNLEGSRMYEDICRELGVAFKRCGAFVAAASFEEESILERLYERARDRDIPAALLGREEALEREPHLSDGVRRVLDLPTTAIITPWEVAIALTEEAVSNHTDLLLEHTVTAIRREQDSFLVTVRTRDGSQKQLRSRFIVDAAGVYADQIYAMVSGYSPFSITPKKGEYYVIDREEHPLVSRVIYPVPSAKGKGVLAVPTIHGNLLIGPSSDPIEDREDVGTSSSGLSYVKEQIARTVRDIPFHKVIRNFAGLRPSGSTHDFIVEEARDVPGFFLAAAIESPGLTAAPAISRYVVEELIGSHIPLVPRREYIRRQPPVVLCQLSAEEKNALIRSNPAYGHMVCRCEQITEGEVLSAIHRPAGARTVKGVKKRCRPGMGRCQGGFCEPLVAEILCRETSITMPELFYLPQEEGRNRL